MKGHEKVTAFYDGYFGVPSQTSPWGEAFMRGMACSPTNRRIERILADLAPGLTDFQHRLCLLRLSGHDPGEIAVKTGIELQTVIETFAAIQQRFQEARNGGDES